MSTSAEPRSASATTDAADESARGNGVIQLRLRVSPECAGWRLDHFLKHRLKRCSRAKIRNIIESQARFSDARPARPASGVRAGEIVIIDRPAPHEPEVPRDFHVLLEEPDFLVLDKPAGLPIHSTAKFWRNTLAALLRERYPGQALQVCHRLDRETSGVLLVARGREAASFLQRAFARRVVAKTYLALVHGVPEPCAGVVDRPLKLLETPTRLRMGVAADGRAARTRYRVLRGFAHHALVEAEPETGRQHQIRVHLASIGHPIVGDKLYRAGERAFMDYCDRGLTPELLSACDGLPRQALHAHRLVFPHPEHGAPVAVTSPLPPDLVDYIERL